MPSKGNAKTNKLSCFPFWAWPLYFLFLWQILLGAQNPGLMSDDSGEMAAAALGLGLPHPPGYPFFNLLGRLVCFVPIGSIAFRLNLFSSFLALLSLFLTLDAARILADMNKGWRVSKDSGFLYRESTLAVLGIVFISNRGVFGQCLTAKGCIYTLVLFFISAAVWLFFFQQKNPGDNRPLVVAWFLWGIGLAGHWQTLILWIPFLLVWTFQRGKKWNRRTALFTATLVMIGVSLYLYLPLRANLNCEPCWGYPINASLFYWVLSRHLVSGVEHWIQGVSFYLESARELVKTLFFDWLPGFFVLGLAGVFFLWKQNQKLFYGLVALFVPIFIGVFTIHEEYNTYLLPVYLVSLAGLMTLFGLIGFFRILDLLANGKKAALLVTVLGLLSAGWFFHVFRQEDKSRYTLTEDFGTNVLKSLPKGAILLADGDHYVMPIWYEHFAQEKRPDLIFVPSVFLLHGWGWKQVADQSEDLRPLVTASVLFQDRLDALTRDPSRHPLFHSLGWEFLKPAWDEMPGTWLPHGLVYAWAPHRPAATEVFKRASRAVSAERLRGLEEFQQRGEPDFSTLQIYRYYTDQLTALKQ
jgi:hypothetical protein